MQALKRAIVATSVAKIILRSHNEAAILELKRQTTAECRVGHGMTVSIDDTTEYESQDNALAEDTVREVKGMTRSIKITLSELHKKDISSKHPKMSWIVSNAANQITRGHIGAEWVDVTSKTERECISKAATCL